MNFHVAQRAEAVEPCVRSSLDDLREPVLLDALAQRLTHLACLPWVGLTHDDRRVALDHDGRRAVLGDAELLRTVGDGPDEVATRLGREGLELVLIQR